MVLVLELPKETLSRDGNGLIRGPSERVHSVGTQLGRSVCGPTCGRYFQWEQKVLDFAPQMNKDTCLIALFYVSGPISHTGSVPAQNTKVSLLNQRTLLVVRSVLWKSTRIEEDVPFNKIKNFIGKSLCSFSSYPGSIQGKDWRIISHKFEKRKVRNFYYVKNVVNLNRE